MVPKIPRYKMKCPPYRWSIEEQSAKVRAILDEAFGEERRPGRVGYRRLPRLNAGSLLTPWLRFAHRMRGKERSEDSDSLEDCHHRKLGILETYMMTSKSI